MAKAGYARHPRDITCPAPILQRLAELRAACAYVNAEHPPPPELDLGRLSCVEDVVRAIFSDEILAVLAAHVPHLEQAYGMRLDNLDALAESAWKEGCPKALVAVARHPSDPAVYFCVPRADPLPGRIVRFDVILQSKTKIPLDEWLDMTEEILERFTDHLGEEDEQRILHPPALTPRLVAAASLAQRTPAPPPRRVRHKTFGEGTVLRDVTDGAERKLEVEFEGTGRKLLLERFLETLP